MNSNPQSGRPNVDVVLVSPRNPLNIGATARAMANFGFAHLAVVAPWAPHWREAKSAVGAEAVLEDAGVHAQLEEAVAGCTLVIGTGTLEYRRPEQSVVALPDLAPLVGEELARGGRVALIFGPEKHGLTRNDLALCHLLVEIPTSPQQPSMNLGQAVAVCLYEISSRLAGRGEVPARAEGAPQAEAVGMAQGRLDSARAASARPASGQLEMLAAVVEETMVAARYSPAAMSAANRHDLRVLLRRLALNERDVRRMLGLFRRILWRLRH